jgi:uncharacterized protein YqfB (UPF0267 family)
MKKICFVKAFDWSVDSKKVTISVLDESHPEFSMSMFIKTLSYHANI